jgi:hypothetical protein
MGMAISAYAEVLTDGRWESLYPAWQHLEVVEEGDEAKAVEVVEEGNKLPYEMTSVYNERNYVLFERLAGGFEHWVEACPNPLATLRKQPPEDASLPTVRMWVNDDGPALSVLTLAELRTVDWVQYLGEHMEDSIDNVWAARAWLDAMSLMGRLGAPDDVRMVFWFTS